MLGGERYRGDMGTRVGAQRDGLCVAPTVDREPHRIHARQRQRPFRQCRCRAGIAVEREAVGERGRCVVSHVPRGTIEPDVHGECAGPGEPEALHRGTRRFAHGRRGSARQVTYDVAPRIEYIDRNVARRFDRQRVIQDCPLRRVWCLGLLAREGRVVVHVAPHAHRIAGRIEMGRLGPRGRVELA